MSLTYTTLSKVRVYVLYESIQIKFKDRQNCLSPFRLLEQSATDWVAANDRNLFLAALEAGKSKVQALAGLVSGEGLLPGSQMSIFLLSPHMEEGWRKPSGTSFIMALNPFMRAPCS